MSWFGFAVILMGIAGGVLSALVAILVSRTGAKSSRLKSEFRQNPAAGIRDVDNARTTNLPPEIRTVTVRQYLEDSGLQRKIDEHLKSFADEQANTSTETPLTGSPARSGTTFDEIATPTRIPTHTINFTGEDTSDKERQVFQLYEGTYPDGGQFIRYVDDHGNLFVVYSGQGAKNWSWSDHTPVTELPTKEEYEDKAGRIVRTFEDDSGGRYRVTLDARGVPREMETVRPPA